MYPPQGIVGIKAYLQVKDVVPGLAHGGALSLSSCLLVVVVLWLSGDIMDCSTPGFSVLHYLLEFAQTHVHGVGDAIQPSHPLLP